MLSSLVIITPVHRKGEEKRGKKRKEEEEEDREGVERLAVLIRLVSHAHASVAQRHQPRDVLKYFTGVCTRV